MGIILVGLAAGCASGRAYFADRGRDAADIVSVSVGRGYGVKARVSILSMGLLYDGTIAGVRGGSAFAGRPGQYCYDVQFFACCKEHFAPPGGAARAKSFDVKQDFGLNPGGLGDGIWCLLPPFCLGPMVPVPPDVRSSAPHYFTQVEIAAGLFGSLRLGANPGEAVDFLLGWTGVDFMKDDVNLKQCRESARKAADRTVTADKDVGTGGHGAAKSGP